MKKIILGLSLVAASLLAGDIAGSYITVEVKKDNKVKHPYMQTIFEKDGKMMVMGMPMGTWKYDESKNIILITPVMNPSAVEKHSIVKNDKDKLILKHNDETYIYKKIDAKNVEKNNLASKLEGTWEFNSKSFNEKITFSLPNNFSYIKEDHTENSTTKSNGTWFYDPKEKSVIISSMMCPISGKHSVDPSKGSITINGITYQKVK